MHAVHGATEPEGDECQTAQGDGLMRIAGEIGGRPLRILIDSGVQGAHVRPEMEDFMHKHA